MALSSCCCRSLTAWLQPSYHNTCSFGRNITPKQSCFFRLMPGGRVAFDVFSSFDSYSHGLIITQPWGWLRENFLPRGFDLTDGRQLIGYTKLTNNRLSLSRSVFSVNQNSSDSTSSEDLYLLERVNNLLWGKYLVIQDVTVVSALAETKLWAM